MADGDTRSRVALLLRRAGFGASPSELERYVKLGVPGTLDELLQPEKVEEDFDGLLNSLSGHLIDLQNIEDVQTWWLYRMVRSRRPLVEKMTLFWHGHFAVSNQKVTNPLAMHAHLATLRQHSLGNLRDMLMAISRDPAMLVWLDGNTNRKGAPNENYGRELLELYTLGIGNYTEADVRAAARAFTGWNLNGAEFFFNRNQHEFGPKTFMGETADFDGGDIVNMVVGHKATAERICRKLFAFFAYPNPEPALLGSLVGAYLDSRYDIRAIVGAILRSDAFYSDESRYGHVKSPTEYVVGAVRMLGAQARERSLIALMRSMGQDILNPPNVAGWAGGRAWINPTTLLERFNFAARLATARGEPNDGGSIDPVKLLGDDVRLDDGAKVAERLAGLLDIELSPESHAALAAYVQSPLTFPPYVTGAPNPQQIQMATDARLRGAIHLAVASTENQIG
ncbi:MAG: DUF1800 domain-containing protein [Chloroflexi bacterium]|nr:DUF1800 domain-containing protein [Chloroflexota bacterium]